MVVGRGQGGEGAAALVITRRNALILSAGALAASKFNAGAFARRLTREATINAISRRKRRAPAVSAGWTLSQASIHGPMSQPHTVP